ncbi:MAG: ABC transporter permease, partial [Bacteroidota bacterium]
SRTDVISYSPITAFLSGRREVRAYAPFVSGKALIVSRNVNRVITVKGVAEDRIAEVSGLRDKIVLGELGLPGGGGNGMVIGLTLADRIGAVVGDTIAVVSPAGSEPALLQVGQPLIRRFHITGIYESNNKEYDGTYAFVSLAAGQALFGVGSDITGIELRVADLGHADALKRVLTREFGTTYRILTWYDLHRDLYSVMQIERWMAFVILSLIVGVASFNLLGSLSMSVIEKTRAIGVLKSFGATPTMVNRIFMLQGILVGLFGGVFGVLIGLLVVRAQEVFHLFPLDPTVYIIPAIPVEIHLTDVLVIPLTAVVLCSLAAWYPARRAANLIPVEAIRWE